MMIDLKTIKRSILSLRKYAWFNVLLKPYHIIKFNKSFLQDLQNGKIADRIKKEISNSLSKRKRNKVFFDIFAANLIYGASVSNYFVYKFYEKMHKERKKYITQDLMGRYHFSFNPAKYHYIFHEKQHTYQIFSKYIKRDYLHVTELISFEEFSNFCRKNKEIFIKPYNDSWGRGTKKIEIDNNTNLEELYQKCLNKNLLVEEVIHQHPEFAAFNPNSVNTIRINTVLTEKEVRIMKPAYFKIGHENSITSNFFSGGYLCGIDLMNGKIFNCIDKYGNEYTELPLTPKQIIGFQIPKWDEMIALVQEMAVIVPEIRFVGWDITLTDDDNIVLIEGNEKGDLTDLEEIPTKNEFDKALRDY